MHPLKRIEQAVDRLSGELEEVQALPRIEAQLNDLNTAVGDVLGVLREIRDELRDGPQPATRGKAA